MNDTTPLVLETHIENADMSVFDSDEETAYPSNNMKDDTVNAPTFEEALKIIEEEKARNQSIQIELATTILQQRKQQRQPSSPPSPPASQLPPLSPVPKKKRSTNNNNTVKFLSVIIAVLLLLVMFPGLTTYLKDIIFSASGAAENKPPFLSLHTANLVIRSSSSATKLTKDEILSIHPIFNYPHTVDYLRTSMKKYLKEHAFSSICAVHFKIPVSYCIVLREDNKTFVEMFNAVMTEKTKEKTFKHDESSIYCPNDYANLIDRYARITVEYLDETAELVIGKFTLETAGIIQSNIDLNNGILPCTPTPFR